MSIIKLHDLNFTPFISEKELSEIVSTLVNKVSIDLDPDEIPIFIGILNGSFLFAADFIIKYTHNCEVSFVKLSSYQGTSSSDVVHEQHQKMMYPGRNLILRMTLHSCEYIL